MAEDTQTSAATETPQMPRDTMIPGDISFAIAAGRPEFAHAFGRRIRSGAVEVETALVAGMAHAIAQLLEALAGKDARISQLEDATDDVRQALEEHEGSAARLAQAVKAARARLGEVEREW